jgi:type II secretory pathway pseudopilin PulG
MLRHRRLLADQRGFTMVTVMMTMMILGLFTVGAWQAATGDIPIARADQDRKVAYEAAQAGLQWYAYQLQANPNYWQQCGSVTGAPWVRNEWSGGGGDPRTWRTLPTSKAQFTLEVLDKVSTTNVHTACSTADPGSTALQQGMLRIRATGRSNGDYRSVVGTFRRKGFMDFIYFTQWETQDPAVSLVSGCDAPRSKRAGGCVDIQFASADRILGPFHTNDESILTCDSPGFGRAGKSDNFEVAGAAPGYVKVCGAGVPTFNGPKVVPAGTLQMPSSNDKLKTYAGVNWTFTGQTCLTFNSNGTVDIQKGQAWANTTPGGVINCTGPIDNRPLSGTSGPPNGVIFIENGANCSGVYTKNQRYTNTAGCGDVAIKGTYAESVTIGARNDIIVTADLANTNDAMMGLIAENFVRVYHPMTGTGNSCGNNLTGFTPVYRIDAAILALNHSFIVDNYHCGAALTDTPNDPAKAHHLNVSGAIAQYYRGTVATSGSSGISTGYIKNYNYDDRLKYRSPPNFLDPVQTSWQIIRQTEQQPATK